MNSTLEIGLLVLMATIGANTDRIIEAVRLMRWKRIELKHLIAQNEATRMRLIEQGVLKQQEKVSRDTN